jgi:carboxymethylenebutenolidase
MKILFIIILSAFIFVSCNSKKDDTETTDNKAVDEIALQKELEKAVKYISGRDSVSAYFSLPPGDGPFPALIVIHEWWGLNDWIRYNADAFANKGYAALAIDLYRGKSTKNSDEAHELMRGLPPDRVTKDIQTAYSFLQNNPKVDKNRIGVIGWCMGGGYALQAATTLPKLKAVVMNYGSLLSNPENVKKISCPLLGIFGETDRGIPIMDVQNFKTALKESKKESEIIIYRNVGHAFMNPNNKDGYNHEITERAWREIFAFLEKQLLKK